MGLFRQKVKHKHVFPVCFFSVDSKCVTHWTPLDTVTCHMLSDWKEHDDFIFLIFINQPIMSCSFCKLYLIQTSVSSRLKLQVQMMWRQHHVSLDFYFFFISLQYSFLLSTTNVVKTETKAKNPEVFSLYKISCSRRLPWLHRESVL